MSDVENEVVESVPEEVVEPAPEETTEEVVEPAPEEATEEVVESVPQEVPSTQEVVQNVQEILTTEPAVSSDSASLEKRVKVLEERLESLIHAICSGSDTCYYVKKVFNQ